MQQKIRWTIFGRKGWLVRTILSLYSFVFLHFRLSFVASKLTFTRNCTTSSGRRTEIQWSLFMWYAGWTPSDVPNEPNISVGSFRLTTSITSSLSKSNLRRDTRITIAYHFLLSVCLKYRRFKILVKRIVRRCAVCIEAVFKELLPCHRQTSRK